MEKKFYRCNVCGNIVGLIRNRGGKLICCNQPMELLNANTTDAAQEKHVPVYEMNDDMLLVTIGSVEHPMTPEHYIQWIMVSQAGKTQRVELTPTDAPKACFTIDPTLSFSIFEYCNLHGLWKTTKEE